jgi:preprotein translocase subunit SecY
VVVGQLIAASFIVMMLDELVQKGWGLGSGISLFIMAGVAQSILWSVFSPIPADDGPVGVIPFLIDSAMNGDIAETLFRVGQLPSLFGLFVTAGVLLVLVYIQGIHCCISNKAIIYLKHPSNSSIGTSSKRDFYGSDVMGKLQSSE